MASRYGYLVRLREGPWVHQMSKPPEDLDPDWTVVDLDHRDWPTQVHEQYLTALGERDRLVELVEQLTILVRVGYLVTINGKRTETDDIEHPGLRKLLITILAAVDTQTAISAILSGDHEDRSD